MTMANKAVYDSGKVPHVSYVMYNKTSERPGTSLTGEKPPCWVIYSKIQYPIQDRLWDSPRQVFKTIKEQNDLDFLVKDMEKFL